MNPLKISPIPSLVDYPAEDQLPSINHFTKDTMTTKPTSDAKDIKVLSNDNYRHWAGLMVSHFIEHNLDSIVDRSEEKPSPGEVTALFNWTLQQKKAAGFIARKLNDRKKDLLLTKSNKKDPQALWNAITLDYASERARNRSQIFTRFLNTNFSDGDVGKYLTSFRQITNEMTEMGVKLNDDMFAHIALHHLPEEHKPSRKAIIHTSGASDTALTLSGVLSQLHQLVLDSVSDSTTSALAAKINGKRVSYEQFRNGTHNLKTAHSIYDCFQVHPEKRKSQNSSGLTAATITGRVLCALVAIGNSTNKPILDSGASHSMINKRSLFTTYKIFNTNINVANGQINKGVGSVKGTHNGENITLSNCLHIPDPKYNLISMGELVKKGCSINFSNDGKFDVLQDSDLALSG